MTATVRDLNEYRMALHALRAAHTFHWGQQARLAVDPDGEHWLVNVIDGHGQPTAIPATTDAIHQHEGQRRAQALGAELLHMLHLTGVLDDSRTHVGVDVSKGPDFTVVTIPNWGDDDADD